MQTIFYCLDVMVQSAATIVNYLSICRLLTVKNHIWAKAGIFCTACLITGMVIFTGDLDNLPPTLAVFLLVVFCLCEGSFLKRLTLGIMLSCVLFAGNALADNYLPNFEMNILYVLIRSFMRMVFALLLFGSICILKPDRDMELTPSMWKLLLMLTATPIGIVLCVVLMTEIDAGKNTLQMAVLLVLALFSFWGLLWSAIVLEKQKKLEEQTAYEEMNHKYYENMERQHFEIRRMRHDMANYLQTLSVLPPVKRDAYIAELLEEHADTALNRWCADNTVNAVLTIKNQLMKERGIRFECELEIPQELPFPKVDICALFANALDNAVEACESQKAPVILLKAKFKNGMFMMSVKNPSDIRISAGVLPLSSKKDSAGHGYGLKSIREIVRRAEGKMELEAKDGWFELFVYMQQ